MSFSINANQPLLSSFESQYKNKESLQAHDNTSKAKVSDNLSLSRSSGIRPEITEAKNLENSGASMIMDAESAAAKLDLTTKHIFSNSKIALSAQSNISHQTALDLLKSN